MNYTIDDLLTVTTPKYLTEPTPSAQSTYASGISPSSIASGEFIGNLTVRDGYLQSGNYVAGSAGWRIDADGVAEFSSGTFRGAISAATIDIGGSDATSFHVDINGNVWAGDATYASAPFKVSNAGAITATSATITGALTTGVGSSLDGQYLTANSVASASANLALRGWTYTGAFSATDADTVAWATGTFTASDGTAYSITGGNTGNMAAITYIYLDIAVSTTAFQTTTTAATAVGNGKVLIAVAQNQTSKATYQVFGGSGGTNLLVDNLVANSASTNEFVSNTAQIANLIVTDAKINSLGVSKLTAGTISSKDIVLAVAAGTGDVAIRSGKTDFDNTVAGFILGVDDSDSDKAKFYIGDATNYLNWTGTALNIAGSVTATTGAIGGWTVNATSITDAAAVVGMSSAVTGGDDIRFWAGNATPASAPFRVTEAGALTATSATIGNWTVNSTSIYTGTEDHSGYTANAGDITFYSDGSDSSIHAKNFYIDTGGNLYCTSATISGALTTTASSSIDGQYLTAGSVASASANLALRGWVQTCAFTVTDADTVSWGSGTLTASDGTAYSISAGNTGNMSAKTYVYLDIAVSTTAYQVTTTAATATGNGKLLVAICQNGTGEATFILLNDNSFNINAANIVAGSITTNEIAATTITAGNMNVSQLSAITADLGTITAGTVTGATIRTSASNPKFSMNSTTFQGIETGGNVVFEVVIDGTDAGDVIMGDDATGSYAKWDDSAGTFEVYANNVPTISQGTFGGDGSDGALSVTSGTTTIDCAGAAIVIKNYTSISITSTGVLAFSNPHANGTLVILKSKGNVTLTSSATPMIAMNAMGASADTDGVVNFASLINKGGSGSTTAGSGSSAGTPGTGGAGNGSAVSIYTATLAGKAIRLFTGAGGGTGGNGADGGGARAGGAGGRGGGGLLIECNGAWNFTTTSGISVAGANGSNGTDGDGSAGGGGGGGGGGAGGCFYAFYKTLTANTGTVTITGGTGGTGGRGNGPGNAAGGAGGTGMAGNSNGGNGGTSADLGSGGAGAGGASDLGGGNGSNGANGVNAGCAGGGGGGAAGYSNVSQNTNFS